MQSVITWELPHVTIHALRHTYATTALNTGVSAQNVARCLGHKDGATTLKFYAHYINTETIAQLDNLEEKNISHLGITESELQKVTSKAVEITDKPQLSERIDTIIRNAKNFPHKKSIDMVLNCCYNILCEPLENLSSSDKDTLLVTLAQYTFLKRNSYEQTENDKVDFEEYDSMTLNSM